MDKISCKHCGTKYPADVAKCPLCGASNAPSVGDEFDFLDDDFEVTAAAAQTPDAPAEEAPAPQEPETTSGAPSSGETGRYNWEDILAELGSGKQEEESAPAEEPVREEPVVVAPPAPESIEEPQPQRTLRREREPKKKSGGKGLVVVLVIIIALVAALLILKGTGKLDALLGKPQEEETPELPVAEVLDVPCRGITLSVGEIAISGVGNSASLQATVSPADCTDKINWFSADPTIATVDANGTVTAVAEGRVNIQVTCGDYAATCMVVIGEQEAEEPVEVGTEEETGEPAEQPTGEPELSATDITMTYPGEMARLYVNNVADDAEIKWSTDNEELLSIDDTGLITALGTGTTNVYAEVDGESLACIVRLRLGGEEGAPITVSLNSTDISMFYKDETFRLEVTYAQGEPEGVTHEWVSSDEAVCTVNEDGVITAVGAGTAFVSTVADDINLKCIVRVNLETTTE